LNDVLGPADAENEGCPSPVKKPTTKRRGRIPTAQGFKLQDDHDIRLVDRHSNTKIAARVQTKQQCQRWIPGTETRGRRAGKTGYI
jgi:hypothetical protein